MPIIITEPDFLSDKLGILPHIPPVSSDAGPLLPDALNCTGMMFPKNTETPVPVFFFFHDETPEKEENRFLSLFDKMVKNRYAVISFQISKGTHKEMYLEFQQFKTELFDRYRFLDEHHIYAGGFGRGVSMLLYLTGRCPDIAAAVSISGFVNETTAYGNYENSHAAFQKSGYTDFKSYLYAMAECCALSYVDTGKTPYLILHGHEDRICPEEQSEELFSAIKDRTPEVPCRMVIFPGENHEILKPGHRRFEERILNEILSWFQACQ